MFIRVGSIWECYQMLLEEGDFTVEKKSVKKVKEGVAKIYWCVAVAIYLAWSFLTNDWGITWVVWPIAGILFAVVSFMVVRFLDWLSTIV